MLLIMFVGYLLLIQFGKKQVRNEDLIPAVNLH